MISNILLASAYSLVEDPWERRQMKPYPPLGILYVASYLRTHGYENDSIRMFDATLQPGWQRFITFLDEFKPDILGITTSTITEQKAAKMVKRIKREFDIPVIVGGPGPTMNPKVVLDSGADCAVIGEGEKTTVEVFDHFLCRNDTELEKIEGIAYREGKKNIQTAKRTLIPDLGTIPYPARDLLDMDAYREVWEKYHRNIFYSSLITARGCPYSCSWCARDLSFGQKYRIRPIADIIGEIKELKEVYQVQALRLVDDILTVNRKRSLTLFETMIQENVRIPFECLSRVDKVDKELLALMKKAGLQTIYFGVESGSQRVLDAMNKQISICEIYRTSRIMKKLQIRQSWFLMMAYPPEDWEDLQKTFQMVRDLTPDKFGITIAYPLPNTRFYQELVENNRLLPMSQWEQSLDNKLLFKANFSSEFYKWAIRKLHLTIRTKKLRDRHNNIITRVLDTGAVLCSDQVLKWFARGDTDEQSQRT